MKLQKPKKLQKGDKLASISLSWGGAAIFPERYQLGKKRFEEAYGVELVETRHALRDPQWLFDHPEARAQDLMEAFADPSIKGIISIIGGTDSIRMLPHIDFDVIRANPKVFMGYSDTTVSHFICLKAGVSSFYGPSILAEYAENVEMFAYTREAVRRTLFEGGVIGEIKPNLDEWTGQMLPWEKPENSKIKRIRSKPMGPQLLQGTGKIQGHLIGGCVEVVDWFRGTSLWPEPTAWDGAILFLETSEERPPAALFRYMLRCLGVMGVFDRIAGVLLGRPMCDPDPAQMMQYDKQLVEFVVRECKRPDLPILSQLDFGHSDPQFVLPIGCRAEIDCERRSLALIEPCVS
ncbi:MAG: LD-carboxypeptidase [Proteobacteria bacterium]|jgi:muramoyltetrapeptide carboxypeptidase LdcA involved in peptidoglycan recycling|nr:LD-carboxypeptidase [Alphaproteobacteria bacterium]NCC03543.1 LD-carboxypeptidase [Pseudomonadota bacterium]